MAGSLSKTSGSMLRSHMGIFKLWTLERRSNEISILLFNIECIKGIFFFFFVHLPNCMKIIKNLNFILSQVMLLFVQTKVIASFEERAKIVKFCIEVLDKGLLLGGPIPYMPNLLTTIAYKLNNYYYSKLLFHTKMFLL